MKNYKQRNYLKFIKEINTPVGIIERNKITFPINATPQDKLLLILGRIFTFYLNYDKKLCSNNYASI